MTLTRRDVLRYGAVSAMASALPVLRAEAKSDGYVELVASAKPTLLDPERKGLSDLWLYNEQTPGPEIRVKQGDRVRVKFTNRLDFPSAIHWHGIRINNAMDGVPGLTQDAVKPGESFDYDFIVPDAGTYWYHSHSKSWEQVARGLYGALIVDEAEPVFDQSHDITMVVDDWRLDKKGAFDVASLRSLRDWSHAGRLGNWLTVNGKSRPEFKLRRGNAYRLRLINASNARVLRITLNELSSNVIAVDGQPLANPTPLENAPVVLAPAQRTDLLVKPESLGTIELQESSGRKPFTFANLIVGEGAGHGPDIPTLTPSKLPEPDLANVMRVPVVMTGGAMGQMGEMTFNGKPLDRETMIETEQVWALNGIASMPSAPLFRVQRGQTVAVEFANETAWPHAMHIHGHHFKRIELNGSPTDDEPWRDTILTRRGEKTTVAFVADNPGKWLLHCHMLEHAAAGMNTWFEVV